MKLPLFPLNTVIYPTEELNLHIFESRYRQLINDCLKEEKTFGIPVYLDQKVQAFGTEVSILQIVNQYADGRMDIRIKGERVFKLLEFVNPMPEKLYAGGQVDFSELTDDSDVVGKVLLMEAVQQLYEIMKVSLKIEGDKPLLSYRIAHKVGLSSKQEYELLSMAGESERIDFLMEHLQKSIPTVREMERMKEIVRMNGHFRHFDPLHF
jgi:Lon protease-like protein